MELIEFMRLLHIFLSDRNPLLQAKGNDSIFLMQCYSSLAFWFLSCKYWQSLQSFMGNTPLCTGITLAGWGDTIHTWGTCTCPTCQVSQGTQFPRLATAQRRWLRACCACAGLRPCWQWPSCPALGQLCCHGAVSSGWWQQLLMGRLARNKSERKLSIC